MHILDQAFQEYGEMFGDKTARKRAVGPLKVMRIVYGPLSVEIKHENEQQKSSRYK